MYLHVLDWADRVLALPSLGAGKWKAKSWPDGRPLHVTQSNEGMSVDLPVGESPDRIVVLIKGAHELL